MSHIIKQVIVSIPCSNQFLGLNLLYLDAFTQMHFPNKRLIHCGMSGKIEN